MNEIIFAQATHLEGIISLWRVNRATLGLMPRDAFVECIKKKWILVHVNSSNEVNGYLQFRYTQSTQAISIVHLCVDISARGEKISEKLLGKLVEEFSNKATGIKLNCRSDYTYAIAFWQRYNFQPKGQLPSRGTDPNIHLIVWWYSFGKTDLFTFGNSDKLKAVLDFNIIAKLRDLSYENDQRVEEVEYLRSDWLVDEVEYFQTSETLSEIFRDQDIQRRERSRLFIKGFPELNIDKTEVNKLERELQLIFPGTSSNDRSDRRQLAETILSRHSYFITLDEELLNIKKEIAENYALKIMSPSELVLEIDAHKNIVDYFPSRLSGNNFTLIKMSSNDLDFITGKFLNTANGERKGEFAQIINKIICNDHGNVHLIKEKNEVIAVIGTVLDDNTLRIPVVRIKSFSLRTTIFMQSVHNAITNGVKNKVGFLRFEEKTITNEEQDILLEYGFYERPDGHVKVIINEISTIEDLKQHTILSSVPELSTLIMTSTDLNNRNPSLFSPYTLERKLWPLKITDGNIQNYIVPIKPSFARELFDVNAAEQDLFGANPYLIWSKENVYYRNIKPNIESYPARILWYASSSAESNRQKSIVCSSYLDEVITGPAKTLFKKFRKFGIYDWSRDIFPMVKGEAEKEIKVLRFSNSEPFNNPVSLSAIKSILKKNSETDNNFQSPLRISTSTFMEIYSLGKKRLL